jgi:hypothetical protein
MIWIITGWDIAALCALGLVAWFAGASAATWLWLFKMRDRWEDTAWEGGYAYRIREAAEQLAAVEADRVQYHLENPYPDVTAPAIPLPALPSPVRGQDPWRNSAALADQLEQLFHEAAEVVDKRRRLPGYLLAANGGHDTVDASVDSIMLRALTPEMLERLDTFPMRSLPRPRGAHELPGASS